MAGLLSIVATPIGNLADLSPRAIHTLSNSNIIFAESPLHSRRLFSHAGIDISEIKLVSCSAPQEKGRIPMLLEALEEGLHVSLISDAGAPMVSDPGSMLIRAVIEAGHRIEVIPGPSAVIATLMGAGIIAHRFAFLGFLPKKGLERLRLIKESHELGLAVVLFESPYRIHKMLDELYKLLGSQKVVVARELTKHFETFHRGILGQELEPKIPEKGEMVIVIEASH